MKRLTLLITNVIKVSGLGIAIHEVFWLPQPRTLELVLSAFMMAGAQVSEELLLQLAGRFLGSDDTEQKPKEKER